jgi:HEAT repeat protein
MHTPPTVGAVPAIQPMRTRLFILLSGALLVLAADVGARRHAAPTAPPPLEIGAAPAPAAGIPADVGALIAQLDDPEPATQVRASLALRDLGPAATAAVSALIKRFRSTVVVVAPSGDSVPVDSAVVGLSPARAAALALVAIGDAAVEPLVAVLRHSDPQMRAGAAWALGELKDGRSVEGLVEAARDGRDDVRRMAVEALGKIRDPKTIPIITSLGAEDESPAVRSAARQAQRSVSEIPLLIQGLRDKSRVVKDNSAYILWLLTAKEFRRDAEQWEAWWQEQQALDAAKPPAAKEDVPKARQK